MLPRFKPYFLPMKKLEKLNSSKMRSPVIFNQNAIFLALRIQKFHKIHVFLKKMTPVWSSFAKSDKLDKAI